jgi:hypothetical protein
LFTLYIFSLPYFYSNIVGDSWLSKKKIPYLWDKTCSYHSLK